MWKLWAFWVLFFGSPEFFLLDDDDDDDSLASWSFSFGCSNNFLLLGGCLLQEILALILDPGKHDSGTTLDNSSACWPAPKTRSFLCFLSFFVFLVLSL